MAALSKAVLDANRAIANRLLALRREHGGAQALYFCSASPGEGTSSVVLALAETLAEGQDLRVLLVDCNYRNFELSETFERKGLGAGGHAQGGYRVFDTKLANTKLAVCRQSAVPGHAMAPLARLLTAEREHFDVLIIDGCSLDELNDLSGLRSLLDGVVLVVESERHRAEVLAEQVRLLETCGVHVLGTILNKKRKWIPDAIYRLL